MKIRWLRLSDSPPQADIMTSLYMAADVLRLLAGGRLHRAFAAVVVTDPKVLPETQDPSWDSFLHAIRCEAWIGAKEYRSAERDYLENARHKAFTAWRLPYSSTGMFLLDDRDRLVDNDSLWPGAIWSMEVGAIAVSGLTPEEDEWLSGQILRRIQELSYLEDGRDCFKSIYPEGDQDTFGGLSFNYPPDFSIFDGA